MLRTIFLSLLLWSSIYVIDGQITGPSLYSSAMSDWSFAYRVASNVSVPFATSNDGVGNRVTVVDGYEQVDESNFLCPIISYPIAVVANLGTEYNLLLTKNILIRILTTSNVTFQDPEIVALNPDIPPIAPFVRVFLVSGSSPITSVIVKYLFDREEDSWSFLDEIGSTNWRVFSSSYESALSSLGIGAGSLTFVPYPIAVGRRGLSISRIQKPDGIATVRQEVQTNVQKNGRQLIASRDTATGWPMQVYGYIAFNEQTASGPACEENLVLMRFVYWSLGNPYLYSSNQQSGFQNLDQQTYQTLRTHLVDAKCGGETILKFNNLSEATRSDTAFGLSVSLMILFVIMIIVCWLLHPSKARKIVIANHFIVVLGVLCTLAAFIVYWYPPDDTSKCVSRYWLLGLGYTNVIAAIYIYTFSLNMIHSKKNLTQRLISVKGIVLGYLALEVVEVAILILWTVIDPPESKEIILDPIKWETIYTCETNNVIETIQIIYFIFISLWGCYVLYRYWKKQSTEDSRWLLVALYNQLLVFCQLLIITNILDLTDDQLYVIIVPAFLFAEGNVVFSFFLPQFFLRLKELFPSLSHSAKGETAVTMHEATLSTSNEQLPNLPSNM